MKLEFTYEFAADAVYVRLRAATAGAVARTEVADVEIENGAVNLDFNAEGQLIGIEIVGASRVRPPDLLRETPRRSKAG